MFKPLEKKMSDEKQQPIISGLLQGKTSEGNYVPLAVNSNGSLILEGWDDSRFPFNNPNLETASSRLSYDRAELGVIFPDDSRLIGVDSMGMVDQIKHRWKLASTLKPHLHYKQSSDNTPNWLLYYRVYKNGIKIPSVWTVATGVDLLDYVADGAQIHSFPDIDMSAYTENNDLSIFVDYILYRDTTNTSGKFAGTDPYIGDVLSKEFDVHFLSDGIGSREVFSK